MEFSYDVQKQGEMILKHDSNTIEGQFKYARDKLEKQNIDGENIKKLAIKYKLLFCNHFVETSHFVRYLFNNESINEQKNTFSYYLLIYIKQYYSNIDYVKNNIKDVESLKKYFDYCYTTIGNLIASFVRTRSFETVDTKYNLINTILEFYKIIEEFLIRYYQYSIIGEPYIITARNNCDKIFIKELMKGYSLYRLQKVGLVYNRSGLMPYYELFPVLPMGDLDFPGDEYIEVSSTANKMKGISMVKVSRN